MGKGNFKWKIIIFTILFPLLVFGLEKQLSFKELFPELSKKIEKFEIFVKDFISNFPKNLKMEIKKRKEIFKSEFEKSKKNFFKKFRVKK